MLEGRISLFVGNHFPRALAHIIQRQSYLLSCLLPMASVVAIALERFSDHGVFIQQLLVKLELPSPRLGILRLREIPGSVYVKFYMPWP